MTDADYLEVKSPRAFVRFTGGPLVARIKEEWGQSDCLFPFAGSWPPPERLILAVSKVLGAPAIIDPGKMDETTMGEIAERFDSAEYVRGDYSKLTDEQAAATSFIVRGAEYELALQ